jgi:hypothetical protein
MQERCFAQATGMCTVGKQLKGGGQCMQQGTIGTELGIDCTRERVVFWLEHRGCNGPQNAALTECKTWGGTLQRNGQAVIASMHQRSGDEGKSGGCPQTQGQLDRVAAVMG